MTELQAVYLLAAAVVVLIATAAVAVVVVVVVVVVIVVVIAIRIPSRVKKFLTSPNCSDRLCDMKGSLPPRIKTAKA